MSEINRENFERDKARVHSEEPRVRCGCCGSPLRVTVPPEGPHWLVERHDCPLAGSPLARGEWQDDEP